jgi:hypothetical protein
MKGTKALEPVAGGLEGQVAANDSDDVIGLFDLLGQVHPVLGQVAPMRARMRVVRIHQLIVLGTHRQRRPTGHAVQPELREALRESREPSGCI